MEQNEKQNSFAIAESIEQSFTAIGNEVCLNITNDVDILQKWFLQEDIKFDICKVLKKIYGIAIYKPSFFKFRVVQNLRKLSLIVYNN